MGGAKYANRRINDRAMKYIITIIAICLALNANAQCIGCPPLTGGSVPSKPCSFNGQTSSVTSYNGVTPTCYSPTNGSLNGHLQGINNALCFIRGVIDSVSLSNDYCDSIAISIQAQIDSIFGLVNNYTVVSSDNSVDIQVDTIDGLIVFDLSVPPYVPNVDATCLIGGAEPTLENILQALINAACLTEEED